MIGQRRGSNPLIIQNPPALRRHPRPLRLLRASGHGDWMTRGTTILWMALCRCDTKTKSPLSVIHAWFRLGKELYGCVLPGAGTALHPHHDHHRPLSVRLLYPCPNQETYVKSSFPTDSEGRLCAVDAPAYPLVYFANPPEIVIVG